MASKGDRRRQAILACVADLLESSSYEEITIAEIMRRAEVTRPGFYFYFPTKGAAVASLMEALFPEFAAAAAVWYEHSGTNQVRTLREGMTATVDLWRKHAHVMHGMVQAASADTHAAEIWEQWVAAFVARAVPTITADAGTRLTKAGTSVESVAELLVDATFAAMRRDVRSLVERGEEDKQVLASLVFLWTQTLYPGKRAAGVTDPRR